MVTANPTEPHSTVREESNPPSLAGETGCRKTGWLAQGHAGTLWQRRETRQESWRPSPEHEPQDTLSSPTSETSRSKRLSAPESLPTVPRFSVYRAGALRDTSSHAPSLCYSAAKSRPTTSPLFQLLATSTATSPSQSLQCNEELNTIRLSWDSFELWGSRNFTKL